MKPTTDADIIAAPDRDALPGAPTEHGWHWVEWLDRRAATGLRRDACRLNDYFLGFQGTTLWTPGFDWPADMRCAPILDPARIHDAARREGMEEAAGWLELEAHKEAELYAGERSRRRLDALMSSAAFQRAARVVRTIPGGPRRIPAPPAEAPAHTNSAQVGTTLVDAPSDAELRALRALECKVRESNYMTPGVHRALAALDAARGGNG